MKMKNIFIIILIFTGAKLYSQEIILPPVVDFKKYQVKDRMAASSIRIWGWSRDGKVAFSDLHWREGIGGYVTTVSIFDFVDDTILFKNSKETYDVGYECYTKFAQSYANNISPKGYDDFFTEFMNLCIANNIEFVQTEFKEFPVLHNNQVYTVSVDVKLKEKTDDDYGMYNIQSYKVIVNNNGRQKIISEKKTVYADEIFHCGYFISPYKDRALIVIGEELPRLEGYRVNFIGCHLETGF